MAAGQVEQTSTSRRLCVGTNGLTTGQTAVSAGGADALQSRQTPLWLPQLQANEWLTQRASRCKRQSFGLLLSSRRDWPNSNRVDSRAAAAEALKPCTVRITDSRAKMDLTKTRLPRAPPLASRVASRAHDSAPIGPSSTWRGWPRLGRCDSVAERRPAAGHNTVSVTQLVNTRKPNPVQPRSLNRIWVFSGLSASIAHRGANGVDFISGRAGALLASSLSEQCLPSYMRSLDRSLVSEPPLHRLFHWWLSAATCFPLGWPFAHNGPIIIIIIIGPTSPLCRCSSKKVRSSESQHTSSVAPSSMPLLLMRRYKCINYHSCSPK